MPHPSDPRLLVLHGLRLKGFARADAVAAALALEGAEVESHLRVLAGEGLATYREGRLTGWLLTPSGRDAHQRLVHAELDEAGCRTEVDAAYRRFLALNGDMLAICTAWQMRDLGGRHVPNDHADPGYDRAVIERLVGLHDTVRPVVVELREHLARFGGYSPRLRGALERVVDGHRDWFTKPMIDSYHTVWFELHEDLLVTLGLERAKEAHP